LPRRVAPQCDDSRAHVAGATETTAGFRIPDRRTAFAVQATESHSACRSHGDSDRLRSLAPWLPFALPQRWPFCWWLAIAVDHYSRRIMGFAVFSQPPESKAVRTFLGRVMRNSGVTPRYLITDQGRQFTSTAFRRWCRRRGIRQRFGAVDKHGSLSVVERCIRTLKDECTRRLSVSYRQTEIRKELALFVTWYDQHRPNTGLDGRTPDEVYFGLRPACLAPRYEPRRKWPRRSPCAAPQTKIRGRRGVRVELHVQCLAGRKHLPIVELKRAA